MRVPISYALHGPERIDLPVPPLDLAEVGALTFEAPDPETFPCLRLAREAGEAGGPRPACSTPPTRSPSPPSSTARSRSPAIAAVVEAHARGRAGAGPPATSRTCSSATPRRAASERRGRQRRRRAGRRRRQRERGPMSWVLAIAGFAFLDRPPRGGPLHRREGGRDAGRALLPLLPAEAGLDQARRDRVRDRRDPARRLREDHRDEPGGGAPSGGRPPRLLPPAGLEADRRDRRRARS